MSRTKKVMRIYWMAGYDFQSDAFWVRADYIDQDLDNHFVVDAIVAEDANLRGRIAVKLRRMQRSLEKHMRDSQ